MDITKKVAALLYPEMQELAEAAEDNLDTGQGQDVVKDTIQEPETPFYVPERADHDRKLRNYLRGCGEYCH